MVSGPAFLCGCTSSKPAAIPPRPELTIEERRAMQTREFDAPADTVFAATIAVLQDLGWRLDTVDRAAGIVRSTTDRRPDAFGPEDEKKMDLRERQRTAQLRSDVAKKWSRWKEVVIHIEPWGSQRARQRIVLSLRGTLPAMSYRERQEGSFLHPGREVLINAPATEQSAEVDVPEAYGDLFDRIAAAVKQRRTQP
jgi:hypothetical protein